VKVKSLLKRKKTGVDIKIKADLKTEIATKGRLADIFFVPDIDLLWALFSLMKFRSVVKNNGINVVYSSGPSHSNHLIALMSNGFLRRNKIKWVVEFRDPWINNPFRDKKWKPLEMIDNWLERIVIEKSDEIIVTSEKYKNDFLVKYTSLNNDKINYIPNGYDSEDFDFLYLLERKNQAKFKIISTGNYYQKRTLLPFLLAVQKINIEYPELADSFEFLQYGKLDTQAEAFLKSTILNQITVKPFIPHKQCVEEMYNADLLLLIPGPGDGTMPGKTFEYIASGTKILALIDEGPSKYLIQKLNIGNVCRTDEIDQIKESIVRSINKPKQPLDLKYVHDQISNFDRKNIANEVLKVLAK
jgi:glycosyltransferase involved in cell wall biosynthesis